MKKKNQTQNDKNSFFNTPHRKVRTLSPPRWEKSAMFIPYPQSSSQCHAHVTNWQQE